MNMKRLEELENYLCDMVREKPDNTIGQREQLALYLVELEERIEKLEQKVHSLAEEK